MRDRAQAIIDITDRACHDHLDDEYGQIARRLIARLARKRPSPLARGDAGIWAAGVVYAVGQINFLFDPTQTTASDREAVGGAAWGGADDRWRTRPA